MSLVTIRLTTLRDVYVSNIHQPLIKRCISHLSLESSQETRLHFRVETIEATRLPFPLVGPPELYLPVPHKSTLPVPHNSTPPANPMDSIYVSNYATPPPKPYMGFTENWSPTFYSSGNPCLDFFFHVVPDTPPTEVRFRLKLAWEHNPLTALKLVCNLRGVRGTGKSDREGFYASALWIHENHPKTLAVNAASIVEFGYFKDLPEILYRLLEGPDVRRIAWEEKMNRLEEKRHGFLTRKRTFPMTIQQKKERRIVASKKGIERYMKDLNYQFLHDKVSDFFAEQLKADLKNFNSGNLRQLSLAAKWCPSLYCPYDSSTLLCESIARRMFPRYLYPEYEGMEESHYAYKIRIRLRIQVLSPLRRALDIPEVYICAKQWNLLPYNKVPSLAMKKYTNLFTKHDQERFRNYLEKVKEGKAKIAAGALLPHEILKSLDGDGREVAILQWQRMVDDLRAKGTLQNCLAICDVSGSMAGLPIEVGVALGLLVSDLSEEPWKGKLITFSRSPQLQIIQGNDLQSKIYSIVEMNWDMNTDFQKVFGKILEVAKIGNLSEDQMIKRLFVFTDMEFDQASANEWETDYEAITRKFHESGYTSVPEIVFWNLRNSRATPVPSYQKGVSLVSGFSKNLLKLFLKDGGVITPEFTMELAISGDEYDKLIVVD